MNSKTTLLTLFFLTFGFTYGQTFEWAVSNSGIQNIESLDVATDASGNVYTVGQFSGTVDFDPGLGTFNLTSSNEAGFVQKLDSDGNLIWVKHFEQVSVASSNCQSIEVDGSGNLFIVGWFQGDVDFDPSAAVNALTPAGIDQFIVKLDASGNYLWAKQYDAGTGYDNFQETAIDLAGNLLLCGRFSAMTDFNPGVGTNNLTPLAGYDGYLLKLNNNGDFVWVKQLKNSSIVYPFSVDVNSIGDVYATGYFVSDIDLDPGTGTSASTAIGAKDIFTLKLDVNGNFVWGNTSGSVNDDAGVSVHVNADDDPIFAGYFYAPLDIDPGSGVTTLTGNGGYILKMDPLGNLVWADQFGSGLSSSYSLTTNTSGTIFATGTFSGMGDFDPGPSTLNLTSNGMSDIFILNLDINGNLIWAENLGAASNDRGEAIVGDNMDNVYSTGSFRNTVDFDPTTGVSNLTANGTDIYTHKLGPCAATNIVPDHASLPDLNGECSVSMPIPPTSTTDCGVTFDGTPDISFPITTQGTTIVTWTYDDGNGNTATQTQNVVIDDVTNPTPDSPSLADINAECSVTSLTPPTATDNCGGTVTVTHDATLPITGQGTTVVTWTYDDGNGNTATQMQNVVINDVTNPTPDSPSLADINTECSVSSLTPPTATDNCGGTVTVTHDATLPITAQGTTVVTWTYDDGNGNTATQTQNVVIDDVTNPTPDSPSLADINAECSITSLTPPTATDNCGGTVTVTHDATLPITGQGTTVVTWTYDDGNGNTATQMQNVVINDVTNPTPDSPSLADINTECSVSSLTPPTATDNCGGTVTVTHDATLPITAQGTTVVTWTYDDGNGNTATQTQNVVIDDVTNPTPDSPSLADINAECSITSLTPPTATDNCGGTVTVTHDATLPITGQGTTVVTWTYDDGNGNTATQTQNVVIDDVTNPTPDSPSLADINAECSVTSLTPPTATDNCGGTITVTHDATLPITGQGTTIVTWTYNDGNGNTATQTQNVVIDDVTSPVADSPSLADINAECSVTSLTPPTATDNCGGTVTVTHDATLPITAQGTTVVTWTYNDGNGNTATQMQNVVINDVTNPTPDSPSLADINAECDVTSLTPPTATDNCGGTVTVTHDATLPITGQGTTIVTWTYDDGNGNTVVQTQNVIITPIDDGITQVSEVTLSADASGYTYQWVDCDNGNTPVAGATSQSFTPTSGGNYACVVDNGECSVTTACLSSAVGLHENGNDSALTIYPNPAAHFVHIEVGKPTEIIILNNCGQLLKKEWIDENNSQIDVSELTPGFYFFQIEGHNYSIVIE